DEHPWRCPRPQSARAPLAPCVACPAQSGQDTACCRMPGANGNSAQDRTFRRNSCRPSYSCERPSDLPSLRTKGWWRTLANTTLPSCAGSGLTRSSDAGFLPDRGTREGLVGHHRRCDTAPLAVAKSLAQQGGTAFATKRWSISIERV